VDVDDEVLSQSVHPIDGQDGRDLCSRGYIDGRPDNNKVSGKMHLQHTATVHIPWPSSGARIPSVVVDQLPLSYRAADPLL
jgi:hypothetical protein